MLALALFSSALPLVFYTVQFYLARKAENSGASKTPDELDVSIGSLGAETIGASTSDTGFSTRINSAPDLIVQPERAPAEPIH